MRKPCSDHEFSQAAAIFTDQLRTRACRHCAHVEVTSAAMTTWIPLDEYLQRATAMRLYRRLREGRPVIRTRAVR